jgi:hypothetical protein
MLLLIRMSPMVERPPITEVMHDQTDPNTHQIGEEE